MALLHCSCTRRTFHLARESVVRYTCSFLPTGRRVSRPPLEPQSRLPPSPFLPLLTRRQPEAGDSSSYCSLRWHTPSCTSTLASHSSPTPGLEKWDTLVERMAPQEPRSSTGARGSHREDNHEDRESRERGEEGERRERGEEGERMERGKLGGRKHLGVREGY